ncbi:MAG: cytochrome c3 family protein [Acidobacteriota bacterium]
MKKNIAVLFLAILLIPGMLSALNPDHIGCSQCHSLHQAPGQSLTNEALGINVLCMSCHGAAGPGTEVDVHSGTKYGAFEMGCADCHNAHDNIDNYIGGINIKQIGHKNGSANITTPNSGVRNVVFESRGTGDAQPSLRSFADGDEDGDGLYEGVCEVCHTQTSHHRNSTSGGDHTHYVGQTCTDCHGHVDNFAGSGGGCTGCHSSIQNGRRAVVGEFSFTSHHVMAGAVTDDDCGVCHYESTGAHMDGNVDLLNPDTGGRLTAFTSFSRNTSSSTIESWATDVQNNFCFKCHDNDGATATNFSGNALRPFSSGTTDVPNVFDQFDPANGYHHAVRGTIGNSYCNSVTMNAPWDSGGPHLISCFDCHGTSGHGSANQRMLRTAIDLDTMEAGGATSTIGASVESYCTLCHKFDEYGSGGTAGTTSKFEYHPSITSNHGAGSGNELGCLGCHGGIVNDTSVSNGSARGNIHGGNYTWLSGTWSVGSQSKFFMVGGYISGWELNTSAGKNGCGGGNCSHPGRVPQQSPGKEYTN